jgi:hypothetical protein
MIRARDNEHRENERRRELSAMAGLLLNLYARQIAMFDLLRESGVDKKKIEAAVQKGW